MVAQQCLGLRALVAAEGDDRCRRLTPLSESRTAAHLCKVAWQLKLLAGHDPLAPVPLPAARGGPAGSPGLTLASNVILGMCDMPQKVTLFRSRPCSWSFGQFLSCGNASLGTSRGEREPFSIFTRMTLANFTLTHASTVRSSALGSPAQRNRRTSSCASDKRWMRRPSRPIDSAPGGLGGQAPNCLVQGTAADLAMRMLLLNSDGGPDSGRRVRVGTNPAAQYPPWREAGDWPAGMHYGSQRRASSSERATKLLTSFWPGERLAP